MSDSIILSAGVRQNLLSLQNTASLSALTQNRLATGKKVNTALDNPSNFFTSQSLSDRASSLNSLLDSIGQATKTLDAANNGITSLRTLVQSAKSIAQQARQTTGATNTYAAVDASSNILSTANLNGAETVSTATGTSRNLESTAIAIAGKTVTETLGQVQADGAHAITPVAIDLSFTAQSETLGVAQGGTFVNDAAVNALTSNGNLDLTITAKNGVSKTASIALDFSTITTKAGLLSAINTAATSGGGTVGNYVTATFDGSNKLTLTANTSDVDFTVAGSSTAGTLTDTGLAAAAYNSTSLLDNIGGNATLALNVNGTGAQTLTFDSSHIVTLADLNTALGAVSGLSAGTVSGNTVHIADASGASNSLVVTAGGAAPAGLKTALGLGGAATAVNLTNGTSRGGLGAGNTRTYSSDPTAAEVDPTNLASGGSIVVALDKNDGSGSSNYTVNIAATDKLSDVIASFQGNATLNANLTISSSAGKLTLTAKNSDADFVVQGSAGSAAFGLTSNSSTTSGAGGLSSSLLDQLSTSGSAQGKTFVISGTNSTGTAFTTQTITFGTNSGAGQVSTLSELNTALGAAATASSGGFSAGSTATTAGLNITGSISITKPLGTKSSVTVGGDLSSLTAASSVFETAAGDVFGTHNSQPTVADLGKSLGGGAGGPVDLSAGGSLSFTVNSQNFTVGVAATDRIDDVISKLSTSSLATSLSFSKVSDGSGHDHIKVDAKDSSVDFTINANDASAALGLTTTKTTSTVKNSTSLLDLLDTSFGGAGNASGKTLTFAANGGTTQTVTFGTGTNQVQTIAQLNTALGALAGVTGSISNSGALDVSVASGTSATSLTVGGTAAGKLGLTAGTQTGTVISSTANTTRESLQNDFNNVLGQIDALSKDSSYNGINLLNGDDLKVAFNEVGSSSLTISGVTYSASNLGLNKATGTQFQDNTQIDSVLASTDTALTSLRTQASKFGSNLSTVQTRQDFTKSMVNTLQTGADSLVLADTNEEGANLLALQTRQQLSTTALSLANQANQAVLRLF